MRDAAPVAACPALSDLAFEMPQSISEMPYFLTKMQLFMGAPQSRHDRFANAFSRLRILPRDQSSINGYMRLP